MLAQRLRTLAWLTIPVALAVATFMATADLPSRISDHRALFSVIAHWLPFVLAGLVLSIPLLCAPWAELTSAAKRRSTRLVSLGLGLAGAGTVLWLGEADFVIREFQTCCDLATREPVGLFIAPWLGVVLLAQSHMAEVYSCRNGHARARRALTLGVVWLVSIGAALAATRTGPGLVSHSLAPIAVMVVVDLGVRWAGQLGPRVRSELHQRRETNRTLHELVTEVEQLPDPAALAQGHRLNRLTRTLRVVALCSVGVLSFSWALFGFPIGLAMVYVFALLGAMLWAEQTALRQIATPPATTKPEGDDKLPSELLPLLRHVDACAEQLERAEDERFNESLTELMLLVSDLDQRTLDAFERRGVDPKRLFRQLFSSDDAFGAVLEPDRRRALHYQLRKFAARVRGESHLDPYRAEIPGAIGAIGLGWLQGGSPLDPDLSRTRRRLMLGFAGIALGVFTLAQLMGAAESEHPLALCIPGLNPYCQWGFTSGDSKEILTTIIALTPVWIWICARLAQWAAQLSFLLALPLGPSTSTSYTELDGADVRHLMWSAWTDQNAVGAGERWVFALLAYLVLMTIPALGVIMIPIEGTGDLTPLVLGPLAGLALLSLYPLRRLHNRVVALLVDDDAQPSEG